MAVNSGPQGVYYSGVPSGAFPPRVPPPNVQHASLKRKPPMLYSPNVEKTEVSIFMCN